MPSETQADADLLPRPPLTGFLGLIVPTFPQGGGQPPTASALAGACRRAERAGAGALWACDHLFWHTPSVECLASVAVAATATQSATVGTCVLQLPLRRTAALAKQSASLYHLSGGRLVLGLGIGNHRGEYDAAGVSFRDRGRQLDEGILELRSAWTNQRGGRFLLLPPAEGIPIWVGGSSESALRRAARLADGWIPLFVPPEEYSASMERLDKEAERFGRDPLEVTRGIVVFVSLGGPDAARRGVTWMSSLYSIPPEAFGRHLVTGQARSVASSLVRFEEAGAEHVAVFITDDDPLTQFEDLVGALAELRG